MSNHLAVATVTSALGHLVQTSAQTAVSGVALRLGRPTAPAGDAERRKVHVYLYQVTPNGALRNADLPTRGADGKLTARPQVALDLHYLVTFYGDEAAFEPDRMLGAVVRDLHARPVLTPAAIQDGIENNGPLTNSNLAAAIERVKFTPLPLSLEELSKLWSVFIQTPHALSVAYLGTVVLIEAEESGPRALPVLRRGDDDRGVETRIGPFPRLDSVHIVAPAASPLRPRLPSYPNAELGLQLSFAGANLGGDEVTLRFSHPRLGLQDVVIPAENRSAAEVRFLIPDDAPAQAAAAGIYSVVAIVKRGATEYTSNTLPLPLAPHVTQIAPNPAARVAGSVTLTVTCRPQVHASQSVVLLLADREIPAQTLTGPSATLTFTIANAPVVIAELVQVRVDGVTSLPFRFDETTRRLVFDDAQRITIQ